MNLIKIPAYYVDAAWKDGASQLAESCAEECTIDQLRMLLARDERTLIRCDIEGQTVGWGVFRIEQLPNMRVFFITNLAGRGMKIERFFEELKLLAASYGCSRIRCAAKPALERLYKQKLQFEPVYQIMEVEV